MADINNVTLVGRLVRDAEARTTKSGKNIAAFTLAVSGIEKEYVDFIDCLAWGKTADVVTKYTGKGKRVGIVGKLHINKYETKDGEKRSRAEVIVNSIQLLSSAEAPKKEETKPSDEVNLDDVKLDEEGGIMRQKTIDIIARLFVSVVIFAIGGLIAMPLFIFTNSHNFVIKVIATTFSVLAILVIALMIITIWVPQDEDLDD